MLRHVDLAVELLEGVLSEMETSLVLPLGFGFVFLGCLCFLCRTQLNPLNRLAVLGGQPLYEGLEVGGRLSNNPDGVHKELTASSEGPT